MTSPIKIKEDSFQRLETLPQERSINILAYGPAGSGKTNFCGSAGSRSLYIDCGTSQETLKSPYFKQKYKANPIIVSILEKLDAKGFPESDAFDLLCDTIDFGLNKFKDDIDTVCVDDMTSIRRFAMNKAMSINAGRFKGESALSISQKYGVFLPGVADFGVEMSIIQFFFGTYVPLLKSLDKNLIITAHERLITKKATNNQGNPIIGAEPVLLDIRPGFTGEKFPDQVTGYFDNVWYFKVTGSHPAVNFVCQTVGSESLTAKTRHGGIFNATEYDPDFLKMWERIKNNVPAPKQAGQK